MKTRKGTRRKALVNQIERLIRGQTVLQGQSDRLSRIRLVVFFIGIATSAAALIYSGIWLWVVVSVAMGAAFLTAVFAHRQVEESLRRTQIWIRIKETHLARMVLDWEKLPAAEPVPPRLDHPFALDLDLIGERSLHQLLDSAVSVEGSQRLRDWLLDNNPDHDRINNRQALVRELSKLTLFRDKLQLRASLVARKSGEKWPGQKLLDWLSEQIELPALRPVLLILIPLAIVNAVLWLLNINGILPPFWMATWGLYVIISMVQLRRIGPIFNEAFFLQDGLEQLQALFDFLEHYRYGRNSHLRALCMPFLESEGAVSNKRPSHHLKRIGRIVAAIGLQKNPFVWMGINAIIPWDIYFARRLNQCKRDLDKLLPRWLDVWFELEALNSLATFAYLNPDNTFPEIVTDKPAFFQAEAIGHPLIPDETRVCNDFTIQQPGTIDLITGSNMAGKSSFLRALGANMSLGYAGGPVLARSLQTSLFRIFTSIRITDSVTDGFSYFYAEVQRLNSLLVELENDKTQPLFFLIDEIFRGTNNRERLIGSRAYIHALAGGNGLGVIATHDLELVSLAKELPQLTNYHFRDDVKNGRMVFDYKLHSGPCPTTNALKIMRMAGLPVKE